MNTPAIPLDASTARFTSIPPASAAGAQPAPAFGLTARALLALADEQERQDRAVKRAVLDAASAGDCGAVVNIVTAWLAGPGPGFRAAEALQRPPAASAAPRAAAGEAHETPTRGPAGPDRP